MTDTDHKMLTTLKQQLAIVPTQMKQMSEYLDKAVLGHAEAKSRLKNIL
jgi:hypothetical protein